MRVGERCAGYIGCSPDFLCDSRALSILQIAPKIQTVTVVGHDWGGVPTGELGMTAPDAVDRCVLVNSALILAVVKCVAEVSWVLCSTKTF